MGKKLLKLYFSQNLGNGMVLKKGNYMQNRGKNVQFPGFETLKTVKKGM
jgi:hypothetical protein